MSKNDGKGMTELVAAVRDFRTGDLQGAKAKIEKAVEIKAFGKVQDAAKQAKK